MIRLGRLLGTVLLAAAVAACQAPLPLATFQLAPAPLSAPEASTGRVVVAVSPPRSLQQVVRSWKPEDVARYDVSLEPIVPAPEPEDELLTAGEDEVATGSGAEQPASPPVASAPEPPLPRSLSLSSAGEAVFDDVPAGWRYQVTVEAWGEAGGGAPSQWLNAQQPASATLDLTLPGASRRLSLSVPLDPAVFGATVRLPSEVDAPERVPPWTTGFSATLREAGAANPLATASWPPNKRAQFVNVPGDRPLALDVSYMSPAGSRTVSVPSFVIPRLDGDTLVMPEIEPPPPPTGTQLGYQAFPGGAFMGAFDPEGRFWLTNQKNNRVSVVNENLEPVMTEIAVGSEPRGLAIDPGTGDVWVANLYSFNVMRLLPDGSLARTYNMGFLAAPGGIAVDNQGRAWVGNANGSSVRCFNPDGSQLAGSPFSVGSQPTMVVADPDTGEIWVSNKGSNTIVKLNPNGSSAGVYFPGVTPGAIALTSQGTLWLVDTAGNQVLHMAKNGVLIGDPIPVGAGPMGLAVDRRDDSVWVGIQNGAFVTKLDAAGNVIGSWPAGTYPGTLTVAPNGELWVVGDSGVSRLAP